MKKNKEGGLPGPGELPHKVPADQELSKGAEAIYEELRDETRRRLTEIRDIENVQGYLALLQALQKIGDETYVAELIVLLEDRHRGLVVEKEKYGEQYPDLKNLEINRRTIPNKEGESD